MLRHIKDALHGLLNHCGLEIHARGKYRTTSAALQHARHLGFCPNTVIDVGVADGTPELYQTFPEATHLLIEPLSEYESALKSICQKYKGLYVLAAAGPQVGELKINVHSGDLLGSSFLKESDGAEFDGVERVVPIVRVDETCRQHNLSGPYLLKADVQGFELEVLAGAGGILSELEFIILETTLFEFYKGGAQFYDVVAYLKQIGYVVYDIVDGTKRPLDGALCQVNTVFVKESGRFRQSHRYRVI